MIPELSREGVRRETDIRPRISLLSRRHRGSRGSFQRLGDVFNRLLGSGIRAGIGLGQ
jgi:hypothetical protein